MLKKKKKKKSMNLKIFYILFESQKNIVFIFDFDFFTCSKRNFSLETIWKSVFVLEIHAVQTKLKIFQFEFKYTCIIYKRRNEWNILSRRVVFISQIKKKSLGLSMCFGLLSIINIAFRACRFWIKSGKTLKCTFLMNGCWIFKQVITFFLPFVDFNIEISFYYIY